MNSKIQSNPSANKNSVIKKLFIPLMLGVAAFAPLA